MSASFIREFAARFKKPIEGVRPAAERALMTRQWLGNVRELRNVLERACMLADGSVLTERDLQATTPAETGPDRAHSPSVDKGRDQRTLTQDLDLVERDHIVRVLAEAHGNKRAAAQRLGLSRRTLYRRLERYNLLGESDPTEA